VVEVRDNGLGVPEEKRKHLFERYFRAHEDINREIDGTGLGLSIVRDTVTSLGGRAWAEFLEDGTAFFFTMPSRRTEDTAEFAVPDASGSVDRTAKDSEPRS
jgi:signal transduction histidine kinase